MPSSKIFKEHTYALVITTILGRKLKCLFQIVKYQIWFFFVFLLQEYKNLCLPKLFSCTTNFQLNTINLRCWKHWWRDQNLCIITLRPRPNGRRFADDTFKRIFLNQDIIISIIVSLKFGPMVRINNTPALVQVMARRRPGNKPLSGPMMVYLTDIYMRHSASMSCGIQFDIFETAYYIGENIRDTLDLLRVPIFQVDWYINRYMVSVKCMLFDWTRHRVRF